MKKLLIKRSLFGLIILFLLPVVLLAQKADLNVDQILSISSNISGETFWSVNGDKIYYKSGSGLKSVNVENRSHQDVKPLDLGQAGHFLANQNIRHHLSPNNLPESWKLIIKHFNTRLIQMRTIMFTVKKTEGKCYWI